MLPIFEALGSSKEYDFFKREVFDYRTPAWAGTVPERIDGTGRLEDDYITPRLRSTPDNVIMYDQVWPYALKRGDIGYPVIDTQWSPRHFRVERWKRDDWTRFGVALAAVAVSCKAYGAPRWITREGLLVGSLLGFRMVFRKISNKLAGRKYNRDDFEDYVGPVPHVMAWFDEVDAHRNASHAGTLFSWRALEREFDLDALAPSHWYNASGVGPFLRRNLFYNHWM